MISSLQGDDRTVLVCAPSGFGKTSALIQWARAADRAGQVAWAGLTPREDEPAWFWSVVLTALRNCPGLPADGALRELSRRSPTRFGPSFAAEVVTALDVLPDRMTLVLDDVQDLTGLAELEALATARPARLRVVMSSRADPLAVVAPLRSAGTLHEVRADRLRFSVDEVDRVLRGAGLHLTGEQTARLHALTGGWPVGVRFAGTALRGHDDPDAFLQRFTDSTRPIADFLVGEALATLPRAERETLSAISVAGSVPAPLASLLSGRPSVAAHLAQEDPAAAVDHAARAGDDALLAGLVHRFAGVLLVTGNHAVLRRALSVIGEPGVADDPWLALCSALVGIETGNAVPTGAGATGVHDPPGRSGSRLSVLRSITALSGAAAAGDLSAVPGAVDLERSRSDTPEWVALALVSTGGRAMLADTDPITASRALTEALALARRHGFAHLQMQCLSLAAGVAGLTGDYPAMKSAATDAVATAVAGGWESSPWSAAGRWMLAYAALMRSEPAEARRHALEALHDGGRALHPRFVFALEAVHGAALFDSGRQHRGLLEMQQARAHLGAVALSGAQAATLAVLEHHAAVTLGHAEAARDVVEWLVARIGPRGEVLVMQARAEQWAGHDAAARSTVGPLLDGRVAPVLPHTVVDALLMEAGAGVCDGDVPAARRALRKALSSGASLGVVRPFAMAGAQARALLGDHLGRSPTVEPFAVRALAAGGHPAPSRARLDLADLGVVARLASPLSVEQIARRLGIPAVEARARLRLVYRKLGVSSRRTAVTVARERGLLR